MRFIYLFLLLTSASLAAEEIYIVADGKSGKVIYQGGGIPAAERYSPNSTFKIPLALIGYDCGFLKDENTPVLPYMKEYEAFLESWKQDQTPKSWMRNSCVWYSQQMASEIGMRKIKKYLSDFNYGNQDMSGDKGKDNGIARAWLSSSLKISASEQVEFLRKLINYELPVSKYSIEMTKKIIYLEELNNGWKFSGKTGSGYKANKAGEYEKDFLAAGWFVGFVEKEKTAYIVAVHLEFDRKQDAFTGLLAKQRAKEVLLESGLLK